MTNTGPADGAVAEQCDVCGGSIVWRATPVGFRTEHICAGPRRTARPPAPELVPPRRTYDD